MVNFRPIVVVGNLAVCQYVLRRDGVDLPQWRVTSGDGKVVSGPFSSLEEAIRIGESKSYPKTEQYTGCLAHAPAVIDACLGRSPFSFGLLFETGRRCDIQIWSAGYRKMG